MTSREQLDICPNQTTGCYEAWAVNSHTRERRLLSTCSLCVPEEQYRWWSRQVGNTPTHDGDLSFPTAA